MKPLYGYLLRLSFVLLWIWLDSCQPKKDDMSLGPVDAATSSSVETFQLSDKSINVGFVAIDTTKKESAFLIGKKNNNGNITVPTNVIYYNSSKNILVELEISTNFLITTATIITDKTSQIVNFYDYNLNDGYVNIEIIDRVSKSVLLSKIRINLNANK